MHESNSTNIAVLGAGSWGITLAIHCQKTGHHVKLWEFDPKAAEKLNKERQRDEVLKGVKIPRDIHISSDLNDVVQNAHLIISVVPSHVVRPVFKKLNTVKTLNTTAVIVNCSKGIENDSLCRISEIAGQELSHLTASRYAVLSGPSHAEEVSQDIPTAVVVASKDEAIARYVQQMLTSKMFRIYRTPDVVGVELGGSLKNVIAIAAGICDGAGFGDNTKAALQPRGLAEIARLGSYFQANPITFSGLSGIGDLIVTCMSRHSRNRYVGEQIGKGKTLDEVLEEMTMVAEGVRTSESVVQLANKHKVEMPICEQVYEILYHNKEAKQALSDLLNREVKPEIWY
ncbi:MAG: NAD(P)H-dependent glycerol-3-phosphate dehydrogenase [candidate division KSB1 bacterium]|nr:NAD(P)H-dependent glycerol-3-phosphate dehydrogenase [candidate division KSB1 bacterium]